MDTRKEDPVTSQVEGQQDTSNTLGCSGELTSTPLQAESSLPSSPCDVSLNLATLTSTSATNTVPDDPGRGKPSPPAKMDPHLLLNPKAALRTVPSSRASPSQSSEPSAASVPLPNRPEVAPSPQFLFDSTSVTTDQEDEQDSGNVSTGQSSLIDKTFSLEDRSDRPVKRLKVGHDAESSQRSGRKGGDISQHLADLRKEKTASPSYIDITDRPAASPMQAIDLTDGTFSSLPAMSVANVQDVEDEVTITGSRARATDPQEQEVCIGMVDGAQISAHRVPYPSSNAKSLSKNSWPLIKITLGRKPGRNLHILAYDGGGHDFGHVNVKWAFGMAPLMDSRMISRTQARLNSRPRKPYEVPGADITEEFAATINLYSLRKNAKAVCEILTKKKVTLRRPLYYDPRTEYFNPFDEVQARPVINGVSRLGPSPSSLVHAIEKIESEVLSIFDSLQENKDLPEMEPDTSIITTPLLPHQKQGLHFMTEHEKEAQDFEQVTDKNDVKMHSGSLWRLLKESKHKESYYNIVSGHSQSQKPEPVMGGILADQMGLGKTLSIISLIASTKAQSSFWAGTAPIVSDDGRDLRNIKSTLLVAPVGVVTNWEEQIAAHTAEGSLSFYVYHARTRESNPDILAEYDVIITTYAIVSYELGTRRPNKANVVSPFRSLNFFRIVLDEAHNIREPTTRQALTICSLNSPRRWAVTGTPIQNKLEDFGSLLRFIRLAPFDENFRKILVAPFKLADPSVIPKLRLLVDAVTLRRTKEKLDLPSRTDYLKTLQFNKEEETLYRWFAQDVRRRAQQMANNLVGRNYHTFLRTILACRLICNSGDLLNEDDLKLAEGSSLNQPIDLEDDAEGPRMSERTAYELLEVFRETGMSGCKRCSRDLFEKEAEVDSMGWMMECYCILCPDCIGPFKQEVECNKTGQSYKCPFCDETVKEFYMDLTVSGLAKATERAEKLKTKPQRKLVSRYTGASTKTNALLSYLIEFRNQDLASLDPDKPPNKSVVFTGWTTYLDLIELALEDNGFKFARLDGKMSRVARKQALERFHDDPETTVILATVGAGGLGLNLTVANAVFIMEPQWNPAAEAQAVDRVHRLGQDRPVTCVRFIVDGTIENGVRKMQQKKLDLADLSMTKRKLERKETAKERLMNLVTLFK